MKSMKLVVEDVMNLRVIVDVAITVTNIHVVVAENVGKPIVVAVEDAVVIHASVVTSVERQIVVVVEVATLTLANVAMIVDNRKDIVDVIDNEKNIVLKLDGVFFFSYKMLPSSLLL
ncbi:MULTISPECIES: hypothetical protein [Bacillus cereus group]|uniref:hypothetical protein n=1 Tax=Bacillus cereus group TaxID=86661 RepID=UPI00159B91F5|nr:MULTISPECIES: hypothetical protein [Bacillus cereus group]